jgi:hypothetical protein
LVIPNTIPNLAERFQRAASKLRVAPLLFVLIPGLAIASKAVDWSTPEQQLGKKIVALVGPGPASLSFENRSSLGRRDSDIVQNGLRSVLQRLGVQFAKNNQAAAEIKITLSENLTSYVWVGEVRQGNNEPVVALVSVARPTGEGANRDSVPLRLRKTVLWTQANRILDVAVLEENPAPTRIAVLGADNLSLYRLHGSKWVLEQALEISHAKAWPRDLRARLVIGKDHSLDAYLPGVFCRSGTGSPLTWNCGESNEAWPITAAGWNMPASNPPGAEGGSASTIAASKATFAASRNFFTGVVNPAFGNIQSVGRFYSAAAVLRGSSALWLFSATDGDVHIIDGVTEQPARPNWGSDIATVKTLCGAGWQVLATSSHEENGDSVRAYEIPDRDPVPVSGAVDFPGAISALWTETKGDTAVAVAKNQVTGSYEAFRVEVACNQ